MNVIRSIDELREKISKLRHANKSIGLVPNMGYLHEGHFQLVRTSLSQNDITVVSLFVNPLQFNNPSDLTNYPTDKKRDEMMLDELGVDFLFMPDAEEMYRQKPIVTISFGELGNKLEGKFRPGHFDGVGVIVSKLFNLVRPDRAYFGLKDLQQYMLIKRMTLDLSFPLEIIPVATERENTGLAMSSRNARLSDTGRTIASNIFKGLSKASQSITSGAKLADVKSELYSYYENIGGLELEYAEIINPDTFDQLETYSPDQDVAICVAAYVEGVRLIDNLYLQPESHE